MLPAQWRDAGQQIARHLGTAAAQMPDGAVEIDGVPERDGCGEQGQAGGTMALVLEGSVPQSAEAVEEDGRGECVAGLDLARGMDAASYDRAIDIAMSRLRRKLAEADPGLLFETVRGVGYRFMPTVRPA
jgi:hypothetical protein